MNIGIRKTAPTKKLINIQGIGTSKSEPIMSHKATDKFAKEKPIAAHFLRYINPIPTAVVKKKKIEILAITSISKVIGSL